MNNFINKDFLNKKLKEAIEKKDSKEVSLLIKTGADVNAADKIDKDDIKIIDGVKIVNKLNDDNKTVLMHAAMCENAEIVKMLIDAGADVNKKDKNGMTALMHAVYNLGQTSPKSNVEISKILIESGADVNMVTEYNDTALHLLCSKTKDMVEVADLLIKAGADVNVKDSNERTPLMEAVLQKNIKIVKSLIESGADINIKNSLNKTALMIAREYGYTDIVKLLTDAEKNIKIKDSNKIIIGLTGHRDVKNVKEVNKYLDKLIDDTINNNPNKDIVILSALAAGADCMLAQSALRAKEKYPDRTIHLIAPLPLPIELYEKDFNEKELKEFRDLLYKADAHFVLPIPKGVNPEKIKDWTPERDLCYAEVGKYMLDNSDILVAAWNGVNNNLVGGTSDIVSKRVNGEGKPNGVIHHIVTHRIKEDKNPAEKVPSHLDSPIYIGKFNNGKFEWSSDVKTPTGEFGM
jgi:ankyrin repeat protein